MPKKTLEVTPVIYDILIKDNLDSFTIGDLREAYLKKVNNKDFMLATKVCFQHILRLKKSGLLNVSGSNGPAPSTYHKTISFNKIGLISDGKIENPIATLTDNNLTETLLSKRLCSLQSELIRNAAEAEEYVEWVKSSPATKSQLHSYYLNACERSHKLLGQIKALKNIQLYQN